ncbi:MAG: HAMP domain-containing histidine kinase [Bdellovibrionales bacterium]|nr:HAMP domain-containing histidine kinase [Bdellovibrionales bacterium]
MSFNQTSSIVRKFQALTIAVGVFLLLESAGTYIFSKNYLVDLGRLNKISVIIDLASRGTINVTSMRETVEKLVNNPDLTVRQLAPVYEMSYKQAKTSIETARDQIKITMRSIHLLDDSLASLEELNKHSKLIFNLAADGKKNQYEIKKEFLLVKQFALDINESLRIIQFEVSKKSNDIFTGVYDARFTPFIVSLSLAIIFFVCVLLYGLHTTRHLKRSLSNLLNATDKVANGDLSIQVPVLTGDEIGRLTYAFDTMVRSLDKSMKEVQNTIRIRDEFLSIASHELKTPITSLKMQLQFARKQIKLEENVVPPPQKLARVFDISSAQVERLTTLVEDLLDISRIEGGKLSFSFSETNLCDVITSVLERFADALAAAKCTLKVNNCNRIDVYCDTFRIEQVIVNLLSNAMKYSPGTLIEVTTSEGNGVARLTVRDHGIGISPEKHDLIFNRFERVSSDQNIRGLGLGLYISKQIVEAHRGRIYVESAIGKGSIFTVELPLASAPESPGLQA